MMLLSRVDNKLCCLIGFRICIVVAVCFIRCVRGGQTSSYGPVSCVLWILHNRGSSKHLFIKPRQDPRPPFELGICNGGEGQGMYLPKQPHLPHSPPSYKHCHTLSWLAALLHLAFYTLGPWRLSLTLGNISDVGQYCILALLMVILRVCFCTCCVGWQPLAACLGLIFDEREGMHCTFAVFKRCWARLFTQHLDGNQIDLAANQPKPRKCFINFWLSTEIC